MVHLCTITWKQKWSVYLTHIILKYRRCQVEIRTCLTAIQAGVAVCKNGCHNVIFSNWLKEKFQILLEIQKGKLLHNFAKAPFYTLANCTHSFVEGSLLRCEIDVGKWCNEASMKWVSRITIYTILSTKKVWEFSQHITFMQKKWIMASSLTWTLEICNNTIWCHNFLEFESMTPFVAIVNFSLVKGWPTDCPHSSINKTPAVN